MLRKGLFVLIMFCMFLPAVDADPQLPAVSLGAKVAAVRKPTHVTHAGDGSGRLFITEQEGRVLVRKDNTAAATAFLDIRDRVSCCGERGLLSAAFPPGYREKRYFYVNYTDRGGDTVVARYRTSKDGDRADAASEEVIVTQKQPFANHNGGQLAFGPDGFLYIGMGDGGAANDPFGNGQKMNTLLGKMLRIDVESGARPYAVPRSNPFASRKDALPEIWALGLRNPWRFSFDRATGDLYIADVGQNKYEEVSFQPASSRGGENYGWNIMEGKHCFRSKTCDTAGLVMPAAEYGHGDGCSVTGGMVYRGKAFPRLAGTYLYGDYCSGRIWGLRRQDGRWISSELADTKLSISTFGEDESGEVYVADHASGAIYRVE
ncbi:MAG: PQQ-dependent sugar dehydrogenase, partial [Nitrospirota bacterium]